MPTYESKCDQCGQVHKYLARISNYQEAAPICCGVQTKRYFSMGSIPMVNAVSAREFQAYECPVTEQIVTNPKQKRYIEDSNDLVIKEKGMVKNPVSNRAPTEKLPDELKPELEKELAALNSGQAEF